MLPIRFNAVCIYGACLKCLLPELSIPAAGPKDRRLWEREWRDSPHTCLIPIFFAPVSENGRMAGVRQSPSHHIYFNIFAKGKDN